MAGWVGKGKRYAASSGAEKMGGVSRVKNVSTAARFFSIFKHVDWVNACCLTTSEQCSGGKKQDC